MNTTTKPAGTTGTITFDASAYMAARTVPAVRDEQGRYFVQSVNPHLWLLANVRADQFAA